MCEEYILELTSAVATPSMPAIPGFTRGLLLGTPFASSHESNLSTNCVFTPFVGRPFSARADFNSGTVRVLQSSTTASEVSATAREKKLANPEDKSTVLYRVLRVYYRTY